MEKDKLDTLSNERLILLVASGAYASHYGFTIGEWLAARDMVKKVPNLIERSRKLKITPVNMSWERIVR